MQLQRRAYSRRIERATPPSSFRTRTTPAPVSQRQYPSEGPHRRRRGSRKRRADRGEDRIARLAGKRDQRIPDDDAVRKRPRNVLGNGAACAAQRVERLVPTHWRQSPSMKADVKQKRHFCSRDAPQARWLSSAMSIILVRIDVVIGSRNNFQLQTKLSIGVSSLLRYSIYRSRNCFSPSLTSNTTPGTPECIFPLMRNR